jgi:hypothetical protein
MDAAVLRNRLVKKPANTCPCSVNFDVDHSGDRHEAVIPVHKQARNEYDMTSKSRFRSVAGGSFFCTTTAFAQDNQRDSRAKVGLRARCLSLQPLHS